MSGASILRYILVDSQDQEGDHEYDSYDEAVAAAGTTHAVIERSYTHDDSALVWTPNGGNRWPLKRMSRSQ